VVLASGAAAGDLVTTESFLVSSVLNAIPNTAASVSQSNLASGVAGTGPAFYAYCNSALVSITGSTFTKIQLNTKLYDTASNFDSSTNYRFTPNVGGYYQFNGAILGNYTGTQYSQIIAAIYKNGSLYSSATFTGSTSTALYGSIPISSLVPMNGSTDYVEMYVYIAGGSGPAYNPGSPTQGSTYLTGFLARSA
jgi:hypothetical protein